MLPRVGRAPIPSVVVLEPNLDDLEPLIRDAFEAARLKGHETWFTMPSAVLKNRLLQLTERKFAEEDYHYESFYELLAAAASQGWISISNDGGRNLVTLVGHSNQGDEPQVTRRTFVRSDLWSAVLDITATQAWRWDDLAEVARPLGEGVSGRPLPRFTSEGLEQMRRDFAQSLPRHVVGDSVQGWVDGPVSADVLPRAVREQWYVHLKSQVQDELQNWFTIQQLTPPADMVIERDPEGSGVSALRRFIIDRIEQMTDDELKLVQLPATALRRGGRTPI